MHMSQLMPLPLIVSCFSKIQIGFTFLVPAHLGSPGKRAVKRVCVCVCIMNDLVFARRDDARGNLHGVDGINGASSDAEQAADVDVVS